jgi:hypothetical protein
MFDLLSALSLIAPIFAAAIVYGWFSRVLLPRWDRQAETAARVRRAAASRIAAELEAERAAARSGATRAA